MGSKLWTVASLVSLAVLSAACSRADDLCALACDCAHCNDNLEDAVCAEAQLSMDQASTYNCDSAWEAWADCYENQGHCDEEQAAYTTYGDDGDACEGPASVLAECERGAADISVEPFPSLLGGYD